MGLLNKVDSRYEAFVRASFNGKIVSFNGNIVSFLNKIILIEKFKALIGTLSFY